MGNGIRTAQNYFGWGGRIRTYDGGTKNRCLTAWLRPNNRLKIYKQISGFVITFTEYTLLFSYIATLKSINFKKIYEQFARNNRTYR